MASMSLPDHFLFSRCMIAVAQQTLLVLTIKQGVAMGKLLFFLESALLICALIAVAVVLSLLAVSSPDLSAWVQAVGSIAALIIAIFVMARQNRNAARLMIRQNKHATRLVADADRLATLRRAKSVQAVLRRTYLQVQQVERDIVTPALPSEDGPLLASRFRVAMQIIKRLRSTIDAIPAFDLGSFDMADGVLQLADGLDIYEDLVSILIDEPHLVGTNFMVGAMAAHRPTMDGAMEKFDKGLTELDAT